jgi:2-dehydropantoate 2-reductase
VHLRGEHHVVPAGAQRLAHDLLGLSRGVHVRGIHEVDALVEGGVDDADRVVVVRVADGAEHHGPEAVDAHFDAGAAEGAVADGNAAQELKRCRSQRPRPLPASTNRFGRRLDLVRFVVYGAGAIGGTLGGLLAGAGYQVVLIARGAHLEAVRRDGLRVVTPDGERTYRLPAAAGPQEVDWRKDDVVLLAMKSMDTEAALRALAEHAEPETAVVCVQNGVANERAALRMFENVYAVCVMFPASHLTPGVVVAHSSPVPGILDIGRYPGGIDQTATAVAEAFRAATFRSDGRPDIMRWKYAKLLLNLGNAYEAVYGNVRGDEEQVRRLRVEGQAVLSAAGIAYASEEEDRQLRGDILRIQPVAGQTRGGGSSWQSLARGTGAIEADYLNGEIVLLGREHGVTTPDNEAIRRLANQYARERRPPGAQR